MGYLGQPGHPEVQAAIAQALRDITALGKAPGTLAGSPEAIRTHALLKGSRETLSSVAG